MIPLDVLKSAEEGGPLLGVALLAQTGEAGPQNQGQFGGEPGAAVHALLIVVLGVLSQFSGLHQAAGVQRLAGSGCAGEGVEQIPLVGGARLVVGIQSGETVGPAVLPVGGPGLVQPVGGGAVGYRRAGEKVSGGKTQRPGQVLQGADGRDGAVILNFGEHIAGNIVPHQFLLGHPLALTCLADLLTKGHRCSLPA